jgi:CheY-like chemotaxis protein
MTGILVVDDEAEVRELLAAALRQPGFMVWLAAGGDEAIELYCQHEPEISVVLLDVRMPGVDGPQTLSALQQLNAQVRCFFMSGDTGLYTEGELLKLGAVGFLRKPFRLDEILPLLGKPLS